MPKNLRFWRNVTLIGFAHVALISGLIHRSHESKAAAAQTIVWLKSGGDIEAASAKTTPPRLDSRKTPQPIPESTAEPSNDSLDDAAMLMAAKSEIQLPEPKISPTPTATPKPKATPQIKVPPKSTPKPKPKPTATPKPKPSPKKLVLAKATSAPKIKPRREQPEEEHDVRAAKTKERVPMAQDESFQPTSAPKQAAANLDENRKGSSAGAGKDRGSGGSNDSQFGWYGSMLHDRFYSEWAQPATVASTAKNSVLVKIRIANDGRVSNFDIVRPSGNAELDASVAAVAKRVPEVEPLPEGLGNGDHYDVKISFELNSE